MRLWIDLNEKVPVAMTIAGSDSGGGAGIEADLKTFAALGVHGTVALTAITAQNTYSVTGVQDVGLEIIEKQIDAVWEDMGIDAAKTGMLHTSEIIRTVARKVRQYKFPLVVDPVMVAKSGAPLLKPEARDTLVGELIPLATVVTPNAPEAEAISGVKIRGWDDMVRAAEKISKLGPEAVVIKGGHVPGIRGSTDLLYYEGEIHVLEAPRIETRATHGTGCSFSAAIAANLAKGMDVVEAVREAKRLITLAIRFGLPVGRGHGPVNPMAILYREAMRIEVLRELERALELILSEPGVERLVPEVGMNMAMAIPYAVEVEDVAAVPGRIVRLGGRVGVAGSPRFGASFHLARYILKAMEYDGRVRAAINIRFSERLVRVLEGMGLAVSYYDRSREPPDVKAVEGATVPWGVEQAVRRIGRVPDVIYHRGDVGKEPMIVLLGTSIYELAKRVVGLARVMQGEKDA